MLISSFVTHTRSLTLAVLTCPHFGKDSNVLLPLRVEAARRQEG
jgi:hypothetical protein